MGLQCCSTVAEVKDVVAMCSINYAVFNSKKRCGAVAGVHLIPSLQTLKTDANLHFT